MRAPILTAVVLGALSACAGPSAPQAPAPTIVPSTALGLPSTVAPQSTTGAPPASPGVGLPDPVRTPGATNPEVGPDTLGSTICSRGWTATVRPPATYTNALKRAQLASGYSIGSDRNPADYEEDHLVPLEVGGSPSATANLWPEPRAGIYGAPTKDKLENAVNRLVCDRSITLAAGQRMFTTNWIVSAKSLGLL